MFWIQSYLFSLTAGAADDAQMRVAIINSVAATANIDASLVFTVNGLPAGLQVNGSDTTTSTTTTSATLPFGLLTQNVKDARTKSQK